MQLVKGDGISQRSVRDQHDDNESKEYKDTTKFEPDQDRDKDKDDQKSSQQRANKTASQLCPCQGARPRDNCDIAALGRSTKHTLQTWIVKHCHK